jgi:hypothetical protein
VAVWRARGFKGCQGPQPGDGVLSERLGGSGSGREMREWHESKPSGEREALFTAHFYATGQSRRGAGEATRGLNNKPAHRSGSVWQTWGGSIRHNALPGCVHLPAPDPVGPLLGVAGVRDGLDQHSGGSCRLRRADQLKGPSLFMAWVVLMSELTLPGLLFDQ